MKMNQKACCSIVIMAIAAIATVSGYGQVAVAPAESNSDSALDVAASEAKGLLVQAKELPISADSAAMGNMSKGAIGSQAAPPATQFLLAMADENYDCEEDYTCRRAEMNGSYCDPNSAHPVACFEKEASICRNQSGNRQNSNRTSFAGCYGSVAACTRMNGNVAFGCCVDQSVNNAIYCR